MAAEVRKAHPQARVELIEGGRGDFIVKADGAEIWNKKADDSGFPEASEILERMATL